MEWTDTLMLDTTPELSSNQTNSATEFTRVVPVQGSTLLCAKATSRRETIAALELLRGFRATGRRIVLCDTSALVVGKQFGREVVETGEANMLVSCGLSGREVGIGARDAGLDLSSVVVCGKPMAGGQVLLKHMAPGDTVLLLGVESEMCDALAALLADQLAPPVAVAA